MRRLPWFLALILAVAMLGAACGGGDDDDSSADDATEAVDEGDANEGEDTEVEDGGDTDEDESDDEGSSSVKACDLVTEADIEEALPDADVTLQEGATDDTCGYGSSSLPLTIVTVTLQRDALSSGAEFEEVVEQLGGVVDADVVEVDGVGDAAVSITVPVPILYVAVGDDLLAVSVIAGDDAEAGTEVEIELAKIAISRM